MRLYTIHILGFEHKARRDPDRNLVLVKEGFCWPAFFFSGLWALWNRMWLWGTVLIAANIALGFSLRRFHGDPLTDSLASLGLAVVIGFIANDLRRRSLDFKGYREFGVVAGDNASEAERRFFDHCPHWIAAFR
ncbi:MAG: DUF2628 domain-containing protein [Rhodospirillales bacterium]